MCPVCQLRDAELGVLCAGCRAAISGYSYVSPEQVRSSCVSDTQAVLVDAWGRLHPIGSATPIGRRSEDGGLVILDPSIALRHARIVLERGAWRLSDLGSAAGTYVEERPIGGATLLGDRARVQFGQARFYFLLCVPARSSPRMVEAKTALLPCVRADGSWTSVAS